MHSCCRIGLLSVVIVIIAPFNKRWLSRIDCHGTLKQSDVLCDAVPRQTHIAIRRVATHFRILASVLARAEPHPRAVTIEGRFRVTGRSIETTLRKAMQTLGATTLHAFTSVLAIRIVNTSVAGHARLRAVMDRDPGNVDDTERRVAETELVIRCGRHADFTVITVGSARAQSRPNAHAIAVLRFACLSA